MPKALSSLLKEPEIERLMADALLERLTAAGAPQPKQSAAKKGLRGRNVNAVKAKRFKAIVRKAVRDVFEGVSNSQRLDPQPSGCWNRSRPSSAGRNSGP